MPVDVQTIENRLLAYFPEPALAHLGRFLDRVELVPGEVIHGSGERLQSACFPESGIASQFALSACGRRIETNMTGREGLIGVALLLGSDRAINEAVVLVRGTALRVDGETLLEAMARWEEVRILLLRYVQAATVQSAHTALSHGVDLIERRLARWLLMCRDRVSEDSMQLTHEQMSTVLGVRRSGVTNALHVLEGERFISARRRIVTILDVEGLRRVAGPSYGVPEAEYRRLFV